MMMTLELLEKLAKQTHYKTVLDAELQALLETGSEEIRKGLVGDEVVADSVETYHTNFMGASQR